MQYITARFQKKLYRHCIGSDITCRRRNSYCPNETRVAIRLTRLPEDTNSADVSGHHSYPRATGKSAPRDFTVGEPRHRWA